MRILALLGALALAGAAHASTPAERVDTFHEALVAMMSEPDLAAREAMIQPHVAAFYDVETIARLSVGATAWAGLDTAARERYVSLQLQLIAATYAQRFESGGGQRFRVLETRQMRSGEVIRCQVLPVEDDPVSLDYAFKGDKVINVLADGVSDLSLRRAEYARVLETVGFDGLLTQLEDKIASARNE